MKNRLYFFAFALISIIISIGVYKSFMIAKDMPKDDTMKHFPLFLLGFCALLYTILFFKLLKKKPANITMWQLHKKIFKSILKG